MGCGAQSHPGCRVPSAMCSTVFWGTPRGGANPTHPFKITPNPCFETGTAFMRLCRSIRHFFNGLTVLVRQLVALDGALTELRGVLQRSTTTATEKRYLNRTHAEPMERIRRLMIGFLIPVRCARISLAFRVEGSGSNGTHRQPLYLYLSGFDTRNTNRKASCTESLR